MAILGPDDLRIVVESSTFDVTGVNGTCKIINKLNSNILQVVNIDDGDNVITDNIGSYDASNGKINLNNFNPSLIVGGVNFLKFFVIPQDQATIIGLRNYIFKVDLSKLIVTSSIDRQGVRVVL